MNEIIQYLRIYKISEVIDILFLSVLIYSALKFIRKSRAEQLVKGILILGLIALISRILKLYVMQQTVNMITALGAVAIVVVFQPELRSALEQLGRRKIFDFKDSQVNDYMNSIIIEMCTAVEKLSEKKTGALIVVEKQTGLNDIISTGIMIDSVVSSKLIETIFVTNTPLHDGAIVIRNDRIVAAKCILPISKSETLKNNYGTRHRAAVGISQESDALVIIVSEETSNISIAQDGRITKINDKVFLINSIRNSLKSSNEKGLFDKLRRSKGEKN